VRPKTLQFPPHFWQQYHGRRNSIALPSCKCYLFPQPNWVKALRPNLKVEVVKRFDDTSGFTVLPRRWVVERTFGWLMRYRRLVRDYEITETSAEAWVLIAMIRIQLRRLA
jgi:transposase